MTSCKRTWSFRDKLKSDLTADMGAGTVTLDVKPALSEPTVDTAPIHKMSA